MYGITIGITIALAVNIFAAYVMPVKTIFGRVFVTLRYPDGIKERLCMNLIPGSRHRISQESRTYLTVEGSDVYIHNPAGRKVRKKKYRLYDENVTVDFSSWMGLKPLMLCLVLLFLVFVPGKAIAKNKAETFFGTANRIETEHYDIGSENEEKYKDTYNVLVIGTDGRSDSASARADVMMIASFNRRSYECRIISIGRDLYADVYDPYTKTLDEIPKDSPAYEVLKKNSLPSHWSKGKLNSAFSRGNDIETSVNTLVMSIEVNYKFPIHDVVCVGWGEVINVVDAMGGVDIYLSKDMLTDYVEMTEEGPLYYGIRSVLEDLNKEFGLNETIPERWKEGEHHLSGAQALAYIRSRYIVNTDSSDTERQGREQYFIKQFIKQKAVKLIKADKETIEKMSEGVYTSLSEEAVSYITDYMFHIPNVQAAGSLPYDYKSERMEDGAIYTVVDNRIHDKLPYQAERRLVG